jgi:hypothetical protein
MTQSSFPFENIDTTETQFSQWARNIGEGFVADENGDRLEVQAGTGLAVDVAPGRALVRGHYYTSTSVESLALAIADPDDPRLDTVILRLDPSANSIVLAVVTGTPAAIPVAPSVVRTDAGVYELPIANVLIPANSGVPTTITDRRTFSSANPTGHVFVETVYFTSSGTFTKASYPWLRAIRVKVQGAGAGGGGAGATGAGAVSNGGGGSGGGYAEKFITDIAGLASSVTVTVGAGGPGGSGAVAGTNGGNSEFDTVIGSGGIGGTMIATSIADATTGGQAGGSASGGDINIAGGRSGGRSRKPSSGLAVLGGGGSSRFGWGREDVLLASTNAINGVSGTGFGSGGSGAASQNGSGTANAGNGADGIVIVELYA